MITVFSAIIGNKKVDAANGIIFGVSVVTKGEAKGHKIWVDDESLSQFKTHGSKSSEGVKVNLNHFKAGEASPVTSAIGSLKNFYIDGDSVRADLHLLKADNHYSKILELAEKMPSQFGLSVSFDKELQNIGGKDFVRVNKLHSVDLVDDPAANPTGLFASQVDFNANEKKKIMIDEIKTMLASLTASFTNFSAATTAAEVVAVKSKLTDFQTKFDGEFTKLKTDLAAAETAKTDLATKLTQEVAKFQTVQTAIKTACIALKVEGADETKLAAMSDTDKVLALQNGVSATLAKLGIKAESIPGAKPITGGTDEKSKTLAQWRAMTPVAASAFFKNGGKLVD